MGKDGERLLQALVGRGHREHEVAVLAAVVGVGGRHLEGERLAGGRRELGAVGLQVERGGAADERAGDVGDGIAVDVAAVGGPDAAARVDNVVGQAEVLAAQELQVRAAEAGRGAFVDVRVVCCGVRVAKFIPRVLGQVREGGRRAV